jgi:hypothetical protein
MKRKTSMNRPCCVYIDADNQPPALAHALLAALAARGLQPRRIEIFGNATASRPQRWHDALARLPALAARLNLHQVPCHKEAADAALMLALGGRLGQHQAQGHAVVIVSRDNSLLACAERIQQLGCATLVCHAGVTPSQWDVPTVALVPDTKAQAAPAATRARPDRLAPLVAMLRRQAVPCAGGGYRKSCVGALLRRAGLDRAGRAAFLASLPGLRETALTGDRLLHF